MKREQFLRRLRKYCRKRGISFEWDSDEGKGSHGTLEVNGRRCIVQHGELLDFYIHDVLDFLNIPRDAV